MLARAGSLDGREGAVRILMAASRTILQLTHRIQNRRAIHLLVRIRLEPRGMAAGAVRLVRTELPGDDLAVGVVARRTGHTRVVGFVERRSVSVAPGRRPRSGRVAAVT